MEIKGFVLEIKTGAKLGIVKNKLEELVGRGNVAICSNGKDVFSMHNSIGKLEIYHANIDYSDKNATVALIRNPYFRSLINPTTEQAVVPKSLRPYLARVIECPINPKAYIMQG